MTVARSQVRHIISTTEIKSILSQKQEQQKQQQQQVQQPQSPSVRTTRWPRAAKERILWTESADEKKELDTDEEAEGLIASYGHEDLSAFFPAMMRKKQQEHSKNGVAAGRKKPQPKSATKKSVKYGHK